MILSGWMVFTDLILRINLIVVVKILKRKKDRRSYLDCDE